MVRNWLKSACLPFLALLLVAFVGTEHATAQVPLPTTTGEQESAPTLPDELSHEAIRSVLSELSDAQVRELLLVELDKQADARQAELASQDNRSVMEVFQDWGSALALSWYRTIVSVPVLPGAAADAAGVFMERRGDKPLWAFFLGILAAMGGGLATSWVVGRLVKKWADRAWDARPEGLWSRVKLLAVRFVLQSTTLVAFLIAGFSINILLNERFTPDWMTIRFIVQAWGVIWFAGICAGVVLAPVRTELRLVSVNDQEAWFLVKRIMMIFGWSAVGTGIYIWLAVFKFPQDTQYGNWIGIVYYGLMALTLWQARSAITSMVLGEGESGPAWQRFAAAWPKIAVVLVLLNFLLVQILYATNVPLNLNALDATLIVILALPLVEVAVPSVVKSAWPVNPDDDAGMQAAHRATQNGIVRVARIPITVFLILGLANLWGLDLHNLASQGVGAQLAGSVIQSFVILLVGYALWEAVSIAAERQIAIDRVMSGADDEEEMEGEGGKGGTRLGTLTPLLRGIAHFFIALLASLAILGELGVNITPLLAGAGVIGLAIGFGAQTLVRDVLSGFFFLIDDAFRKGEYINLADVAGTVESISIRSMQLRHHNGPLHTIPFGEIKFLTNYSRDWVMMKLPLRVTYDTDVEKLRKMIKKLGQEMLADPELGPKFLQPLKSQGVIQMEDSAMIVRVKFMTRPGDQWGLRTKVFAKIRELFEREGIKFAHREVTVRIANDPKDEEGVAPEEHQRRLAASAAARSVTEAELPAGAAPADAR